MSESFFEFLQENDVYLLLQLGLHEEDLSMQLGELC